MLRRILLSAIFSGLIAGGVMSVVQSMGVIPLIHRAEIYERRAAPAAAERSAETPAQTLGPVAQNAGHGRDSGGMERLAYTVASNLLIGIAFGLLLTSAISLRGEVDERQGLLWGLAGFATFALAPALGLPPELPGAAAAGVAQRQWWWGATVILTGSGLALALLSGRWIWAVAGCVLMALPHVIGAPQPAEHAGAAPEALGRAFVSASLLASFLFWIVLGGCAGFFYRRLSRARIQ